MSEAARLRSSSASSLERKQSMRPNTSLYHYSRANIAAVIPESREPETDAEHDLESYDEDDYGAFGLGLEEPEIKSLRTALQECWTLCNTLANLSTHHRERVFSRSGTPDGHEQAWKCCWKLCQRLYDNQDEPMRNERSAEVKYRL